VSTGAVMIRLENDTDKAAIHDLTARAFAGKNYSDGTEPELIDALRDAGALAVSLVAEEDGTIIGHVALSPAFAQDGSQGWFALGPISVAPERQRQGVGGMLVRESMARLEKLNALGCVLIGDARYYPRHGFVLRPDLAPATEPAQHYMVKALTEKTPQTCVSFHPVLSTPQVAP
jgi:putative acetyltransferase